MAKKTMKTDIFYSLKCEMNTKLKEELNTDFNDAVNTAIIKDPLVERLSVFTEEITANVNGFFRKSQITDYITLGIRNDFDMRAKIKIHGWFKIT